MIKGSLKLAKAMAIRLRLHRLHPLRAIFLLKILHHVEKIKMSGINSLVDLAGAGTFQTVLVMSTAKHGCHQIYNVTFNIWDIGKRRLDRNWIATGHVQIDLSKSDRWQDQARVALTMHLPIIQRTIWRCKAPRMRRILQESSMKEEIVLYSIC
jgi:hypothetical protein